MSLSKRLREYFRKHPPTPLFLPEHEKRPEVLLCANTVKPMHGVVPRAILGMDWWNKTRMEAYRSTNFHCIACGVYKTQAKEYQWLEGHELYEVDYEAGRMVYIETVPLCHYCHNFIHDGRLQALLQKGKVSQQKVKAVAQHGFKVLKAAGLKKPLPYTGKIAEWSDWRLILFGKQYPPIYANYQEWLQAFDGNEGFDKE